MRLRYVLPTAALLLLILAPQASAASARCEQIKDIRPVSDYTYQVLLRAENGLVYARQGVVNPDFTRYLPSWAKSVGSAWAGLIDSQVQLTMQEQELNTVTACLNLDLNKIDCKIEETRQELRTQLQRGSFTAIVRLQSLLQFLNERRRHLQIGALDPLYQDPSWGDHQAFDPPAEVWCCPRGRQGNMCERQSFETCNTDSGVAFYSVDSCAAYGCRAPAEIAPQTDVLCPFNADYAPSFPSGFGCDVETMTPRAADPLIQAELESLIIINREIDEHREIAQESLQIQQEIDQLFGNGAAAPQMPPPRQHLNAQGCGWSAGYCSNDPMKRCNTNNDCGLLGGTCAVPDRVCSGNRALRCANDDICGTLGPCIANEGLPSVRALRGSFSLNKNELTILTEFLGARTAEEISRQYRNDLKSPMDLIKAETGSVVNREIEDRNPFIRFFRSAGRMTVRTWSYKQGREEAAIYPQAVDAQLEIANALTALRKSVSELSKLASRKDGVRLFVSRYAYFIGRTCTFRPCSRMLEQVIKIVLTDECFPYTNGQYLNDTSGNPRRDTCRTGAGL